MNTSRTVQRKIAGYKPKNGLDHTARFFLALCEVNHESTKAHVERVALLAEATAKTLKKDAKATFFAGLLHDIGKLVLPAELFDGHNVSPEEYEKIKTHAQAGFRILQKFHLFVAFCAGLHHNLYKAGYGVDLDMFPKEWSLATIKKVLEISTILSICDFVDAATHRTTKILDGSGKSDCSRGLPKCVNPTQAFDCASCDKIPKEEGKPSLETIKGMLYGKYPDDHLIVDVIITAQKGFQWS